MGTTIATADIVIGTTIADAFWQAMDAIQELGSQIIDVGSKYESSFAQLETIMDTTQMSTEDMSKGLRTLSKEMGISAGDLARTTYNAISATEDTAGSLELVETASKLAVAGFTDSANSLSLLTQAMNAYGKDTYTTTALADSFMQVQNMGVTTIGEMSKYMGRAIGNTQLYGASLADLEKSFIAYTKISPNVRVASTSIAALFKDVGLSGSDAANQLEKATGKTYKQLIGEGHDIRYVLDELYESVGRDDDAFAKLFTGTSRAAATNILKANIKDWNRWSEGVENSLKGATSVTDDAFATMADTAAFKGAQMEQIINDKFITLYEAIGPYLMEIKGKFADFVQGIDVDKVANNLMKVGDAIMNLIDHFDELLPIIVSVGTAFAVLSTGGKIMSVISLVKTLGGLTPAVKALFDVLTFGTGPVGLIIAAIAGAIGYLVTLYNTNEEFRNKVNEVWTNVQEVIGTVIESIGVFIENAKTFFVNLGTAIAEWWAGIVEWFAGVVETLQGVWDTLTAIVQVGIMFIGNLISLGVQIILIPWQMLWQLIQNVIKVVWDAIGEQVTTAINAVANVISTVMSYIQTVIQTVMTAIASFFSVIWGTIRSIFETTLSIISNVVMTVLSAIRGTVSTIFSAISAFVSTVWNTIKNTISDAIETAKNKVTTAVTMIRSNIEEKLNAAKSTVTSIMDRIKQEFTDKMEKAKTAVHDAIEKIKSFFNFSWSLPPLKLPHISISGGFSLMPPSAPSFSIDWYKKAYDDIFAFDRPTVIPTASGFKGFGDGNGREYVMGEDKLRDLLGGGGYNQVVNIYSPQPLSPWETARQTKNATREMLLNLKGV